MIVGGGVAGLYGALAAADEADVVLLSKGPLPTSASYLAQGGVSAAVGEDDSPELHAEDTLRAGRGLCSHEAVRVLTAEAPVRLAELRQLGVPFDEGLGLEGGHSRRRVLHADGAATGAVISRILARRVLEHPRVRVFEAERVLELLPDGVRTERRRFTARGTVLATGGYAALWERTTNPAGSVGEGIALAYRAGAAVADLEFIQFHPTALAGSRLLLSEALRGEGALLLDETGERFTDELAPRDVVARAISSRGSALLDLRRIDRTRFPTLVEALEESGYDPACEPIPVAPAAHYTMGGIVTDLDGRTEVSGLYAAGECACTGVHGANRLASNSLLECLVFGRRAALAALAGGPAGPVWCQAPDMAATNKAALGGGPAGPVWCQAPDMAAPDKVTAELRAQLLRDAGLIRDAEGLERLRRAPHLLARLIAECATARRESRGAHFRSDYPVEEPALAAHTVLRPGNEPVFETWT